MRIDAVAAALPSRIVSNEDVLALVQRHSAGTFDGDLDRTLAKAGLLLRRSGAVTRHWLSSDEKPLMLISDAAHRALHEAGIDKSEVDLLIYSSVDRGYIDPANAYFIANALEMRTVECFDVVDACNSWSRGLQLAHALLHAASYERALLISAEFPLFEGGAIYPRLFTLERPRDLKRSFAGYTIGEAATATVLSRDPERSWTFRFASRPDLADACVVPLPGFDRYSSTAHADTIPLQFAAQGPRMLATATRELTKLFESLEIPTREIAMIFPHAATLHHWTEGSRALNFGKRMYNIFPRCGNVAAASVPTAIALAAAEGRISHGDRVACLTASAGMSFAAYSFVY